MAVSLETLCALELPTGEGVAVVRRRFRGGPGPHVVLIAGVGGDTPEGTRVLHGLGRILAEHHEALAGTVDLLPCLSPLAAHLGTRAWPGLDVELHRRFPGRADGHAPDRVAAALMEMLSPESVVVELRSAHPSFRQVPLARVRADSALAAERAVRTNVRALWRTTAVPTGSLAAAVPDLVVLEGGVGSRLTEGVALELGDGLLNLLAHLGVLPEDRLPFHWAAIQTPVDVDDSAIEDVRVGRGGLFLPERAVWSEVEAGDRLGEVIEPITGEVREAVLAPCAGRVVASREEPLVYPGNLVARLVRA